MEWDDVRFFLVAARRRTQAAAARELGVAQPTVGRRIAALERSLGAKLFVRRSDGFALSPGGLEVLQHAERMEQEALSVARRVSGRDEGLRGTVRVTCSEWLATSVLPPIVARIVSRHPRLSVELVAEQRHVNLARREADLALRPRRFEHDAIVQRATAKLGFGVYASRDYLSRHGAPTAGDGRGHRVVAMSDDVGDVARDWLHAMLPLATVVVRTNGRDAMLALAAAGVGATCLARVVGDATHALRRLPFTGAPTPTLWLGMHRDARSAPRVRALANVLVEGLRALQPKLAPAD